MPGTIAGRFETGPLIGGGATGSVYTGVDTLTGQRVAIKALRAELIASMPDLVERFRREGEALRRLNHPNIVKVLATVEEGDQHYLIMEYVSGGSLADLLLRQPQLPLDRAVSIALELADALTRAHHLEILHRDLKPGNILLAEDGTPRLTDFGLARLGSYPALTAAGSLLGTFYYLSPEACENQQLDARSDLWSFGVVLFEMLAGRLPFDGDSPMEILWAIKNQSLPDPGWYREGLPAELVDLVRKLLMKDRAARLSSARLAGAQLEAINRTSPLHPSSFSLPPSPKIRVLIVDDHAVVRQGLRTFIDLQEDMEVVGEGANGSEAASLARQFQPDVILLDLVMPVMDGVAATSRILEGSPGSRVLILTSFGEDDKVFPAIRAGAQGYLLKDIHPNELVRAVREAHQGKVQLNPDIARRLMSAVAAVPQDLASRAVEPAGVARNSPVDELTGREREVLRMIARGLNNRDIAEAMIISEKTVKTHVSNILSKLGLDDRTQAAIWALKHGLGSED
jgi:DNA-binding NarL/FixJ family response regulator/tRNA A-37 threonylcarbamoyl transferase component Bud32